MTLTNWNIALVNRKSRQMMTPTPTASTAGSFVVTDVSEVGNLAMFVSSATVQYLYHHDEDAWVQIPSGALVGTFWAWACGTRHKWSNTVTANGGTTTTATTTANINWLAKNKTIRMLTGSQAGKTATISSVTVIPWGTSTITFSPAFSWAVANTDTFDVSVGRFYVMSAGTTAAWSFKSFDPFTATWTTLTVTGLPASWATDWKLVSTSNGEVLSTGTATSATGTTLTCSTKTWTTNNWYNFQIRITAGTGIWQVRTITSNTATQMTVSSAWSVTPDATSVFDVTTNDDYMYLLGNNAVTMYRYSISGNSWSTLAPTTARGAAPSTWMSANLAGKTWDAIFDSENAILAWRYIFSFRWGAWTILDRYDIGGGTAWAGAWAAITYPWAVETFTTGSSYGIYGKYLYIKKDATNRFFKYSITGNYIEALSTLWYPDWAALLWDKIWLHVYQENGEDKLLRLYNLRNTGTEVHRLMLF